MVRRVVLDDDDDEQSEEEAGPPTTEGSRAELSNDGELGSDAVAAPPKEAEESDGESAARKGASSAAAAADDDDDDDIFVQKEDEQDSRAPRSSPGAAGEEGEEDDDDYLPKEGKGEDGTDGAEDDEDGGDDEDGEGDDAEEDPDEEEEEAEVAVTRKRKKRPAELDADDLALIEENTGKSFRPNERSFKRLSKKARDNLTLVVEGEDEEGIGKKLEDELFDQGDADEDEDPAEPDREIEEEIRDEDEDDFIESEPWEKTASRRSKHMDAEYEVMLEEEREIFGNDAEMKDLLMSAGGLQDEEEQGEEEMLDDEEDEEDDDFIEKEDEEDEEERELRKAAKREKLQRRRRVTGPVDAKQKIETMYDEETLAQHFRTKADDELRTTDVPERLQILLKERKTPQPNELKREAQWITARLSEDAMLPLLADEQEQTKHLERITEAIEHVLELMRVGEVVPKEEGDESAEERVQLETAFMAYFRKEEYAGRLTQEQLNWLIGLDAEYGKIIENKAKIFAAAMRKFGTVEDERVQSLKDKLMDATSLEEVQDVAELLNLMMDGVEHESRLLSNGLRRPSKRGLYAAAQRAGLQVLAEKFGLSPEQLGENALALSQVHTPYDELETPLELAADFVERMGDDDGGAHAELRSPEAALKGAREWLAQHIAHHPVIIKKGRTYLCEKAFLKVEATQRGRMEIDPTHLFHRVAFELIMTEDSMGGYRARGGVPLAEIRVGRGPYIFDARFEKDLVPAAELLLTTLQAEQEGFVKVELVLPESDGGDELLKEMDEYFISLVSGATAEAWNEQRRQVLRRAIVEIVYPKVRRELMAATKREAESALVSECARRLEDLVTSAPARAPPEPERRKKKREKSWRPAGTYDVEQKTYKNADFYERRPRTVGAAVLTDKNPKEVVFAALDQDGELVDRIKARWLLTNIRSRAPSSLDVSRKLEELAKLEAFFVDVGCECIALGARDLACRRLLIELEHLSNAIALRRQAQRLQPHDDAAADAAADAAVHAYHRAPKPESEIPGCAVPFVTLTETRPFEVYHVDETFPVLWASSPSAKQELSDLDDDMLAAVSCARMLQEPLLEVAHIVSATGISLTKLPLHPFIGQLPETELERCLTAVMTNAVCRLGVDLFDALEHEHHSQVVQFLPGLGPRKAAALLRELQQKAASNSDIVDREGLKELLGLCVWTNAAGFIKMVPPTRPGELRQPPGLEGLRVHPESYEYARFMCFSAVAPEDAPEDEEHTAEMEEAAVSKAMWPEGVASLYLLELEGYAEHLLEQAPPGTPNKLTTLLDIRAELANPFADLRGAYRGLTRERLFELLTAETTRSLGPNMLTTARFVRFEPGRGGQQGRLHFVLQCGLPAVVEERMFSDNWQLAPAHGGDGARRVPLAEGQSVSLKVLQLQLESFQVLATCKGQELKTARHKTIAQLELEEAARAKPEQRHYAMRRINHPLFKNHTLQQVAEELKEAAPGDVIFRPSSKGSAHLTATVKATTSEGPLLHIDIAEENKASAAELGQSLWVGRSKESAGERFDDLDEICARYIEPLVENISEIIGHRKYHDEPIEEVKKSLLSQKEQERDRIPYGITMDPEIAEKFHLLYVPSSRVLRESIKAAPNGFTFRSKTFKTVDELLGWFKVHYKDAQRPPQSKPTHANSAAPSSFAAPIYGAGTVSVAGRHAGNPVSGRPLDYIGGGRSGGGALLPMGAVGGAGFGGGAGNPFGSGGGGFGGGGAGGFGGGGGAGGFGRGGGGGGGYGGTYGSCSSGGATGGAFSGPGAGYGGYGGSGGHERNSCAPRGQSSGYGGYGGGGPPSRGGPGGYPPPHGGMPGGKGNNFRGDNRDNRGGLGRGGYMR